MALSFAHPFPPFAKPITGCRTKPISVATSVRASASPDIPVPDSFPPDWLDSRRKRPFGPRLNFSAEAAVQCQLDALKYNDHPRPDYGIEVMYRFAGFDPFERSTYFGPFFDLGQFERFRRIFHHSTFRVLLGHKDRKILSSLWVKEDRFKQRVWIQGSRPEEEEIFQLTMVQVTILRHYVNDRLQMSLTDDQMLDSLTENRRFLGWLLANRESSARR